MTDYHHVICLAVDGFNLALLGPWGNSAVETPVLNRLAAKSVLFDQYYTSTLSLPDLLTSFWNGKHPREKLPRPSLPLLYSALGYKTVLITDENIPDEITAAAGFDETICLNESDREKPVLLLQATHFYQCLAKVAEQLKNSSDLSKDDRPLFLWCQFRGWRTKWDFPNTLRLDQREDEEDPVPYPGMAVPFLAEPVWSSNKSDRALQVDVDEVLAITESWKAGLAVLEKGLDLICRTLDETDQMDSTLLAVTGVCGFPLGEHGRAGFPPVGTEYPDTLFYSEELHLPLLIKFPGDRCRMVRSNALCEPEDLYRFLAEWPKDPFCQDANEKAASTGLFRLAMEETEEIHSALFPVESNSNSVNRGVITSQWFLRQTSFLSSPTKKSPDDQWHDKSVYHELYVKPDDMFDVNEVSARVGEEYDELVKRMKSGAVAPPLSE